MTAGNLYLSGLDTWPVIETITCHWCLVRPTYAFERTHIYVDELTGHEVTAAGYARQTLTGAVREDRYDEGIAYLADAVSFATMAGGDDVDALVLYRYGTSDADSLLMGHYPIGPLSTDDLDPFIVAFADYLAEMTS